jgi:hypothetical protein
MESQGLEKINQIGPTRHCAHLRQNVQEEEKPVKKRLKRQNNSNLHSQSPDTNNSNNCYLLPTSLSQQLQNQTKWDSPEALSLFVHGTKATRWRFEKQTEQEKSTPTEIIDVKKHVMEQIQVLRDVFLTPHSWRQILDNKDCDDLCTPQDIFVLQVKAKYLAKTLSCALTLYPTTANFLDIYLAGIQIVNEFDYDEIVNDTPSFKITDPKTVLAWLCVFHTNSTFKNPGFAHSKRFEPGLPMIFHENPDHFMSFMTYAQTYLETLSGEMLHEYLFSVTIPKTAKTIEEKRRMSKKYTVQELLQDHGITKLSVRTVYKWLKKLGFVLYGPLVATQAICKEIQARTKRR